MFSNFSVPKNWSPTTELNMTLLLQSTLYWLCAFTIRVCSGASGSWGGRKVGQRSGHAIAGVWSDSQEVWALWWQSKRTKPQLPPPPPTFFWQALTCRPRLDPEGVSSRQQAPNCDKWPRLLWSQPCVTPPLPSRRRPRSSNHREVAGDWWTQLLFHLCMHSQFDIGMGEPYNDTKALNWDSKPRVESYRVVLISPVFNNIHR